MQKLQISRFFGGTGGRIASLLLACVASHTALGAPGTASRQHRQKRDFANFRLPKQAHPFRATLRKNGELRHRGTRYFFAWALSNALLLMQHLSRSASAQELRRAQLCCRSKIFLPCLIGCQSAPIDPAFPVVNCVPMLHWLGNRLTRSIQSVDSEPCRFALDSALRIAIKTGCCWQRVGHLRPNVELGRAVANPRDADRRIDGGFDDDGVGCSRRRCVGHGRILVSVVGCRQITMDYLRNGFRCLAHHLFNRENSLGTIALFVVPAKAGTQRLRDFGSGLRMPERH